ncbi:MAG: PrsW family intramembrane metalloprotease [Prevotella sp.]|nr:PrsW family intramembrane metalloprotease [Prevotella sp.]
MGTLIIIIAALLPVVLLWLFIWKRDPQPEPITRLLRAVFAGMLICFPVVIVEMIIDYLLFGPWQPSSFFGTTAKAFFVAALPEESFKLLALWLILRKNPYFDEHFDGIVYAVCVGLGFAAVENVTYLFDNIEGWQYVAAGRALFSVPGHYAFAVLMGYYYSVYYFVKRTSKMAVFVLLVPIVAHGIYDSLIMAIEIIPDAEYFIGLLILCFIFFCVKMHKVARTKLLALIEKDQREVISA